MSNARAIILGHRGQGGTNNQVTAESPGGPSLVTGKFLPARNDPYFRDDKQKILPENSLSAFSSAFEHGADGFECDVYLSKDKVPMVVHDAQLARNVDGYHYFDKDKQNQLGNVCDYTAAELKHPRFSIGNGESMPTLDELIQLTIISKEKLGRNLILNIEIKDDNAEECAGEVFKVITKYIDKPGSKLKASDFIFCSFNPIGLSKLKELDPRFKVSLANQSTLYFGSPLRMPGWIPPREDYRPEAMEELKKIIKDKNFDGIELVTSDVRDPIGQLCKDEKLILSACTSAIRLKLEADFKKYPEAKYSDLDREKLEFKKLYDLAKKYNLTIYYKADNPGLMKEYLNELELEAKKELEKKPEKSPVIELASPESPSEPGSEQGSPKSPLRSHSILPPKTDDKDKPGSDKTEVSVSKEKPRSPSQGSEA